MTFLSQVVLKRHYFCIDLMTLTYTGFEWKTRWARKWRMPCCPRTDPRLRPFASRDFAISRFTVLYSTFNWLFVAFSMWPLLLKDGLALPYVSCMLLFYTVAYHVFELWKTKPLKQSLVVNLKHFVWLRCNGWCQYMQYTAYSLNWGWKTVRCKMIIAVVKATLAVVKRKTDSNSGLYGGRTHDFCGTGSTLCQLRCSFTSLSLIVEKAQ